MMYFMLMMFLIVKFFDVVFLLIFVIVLMSLCFGMIGYRVFFKSFIAKCRSVWYIS